MDFSSLEQIEEAKRKLQIEEALFVQNALRSGDVDSIFKAEQYLRKKAPTQDNGRAIMIDPFNRSVNFGFFEKQSPLSFGLLRGMSLTPIPQAVLLTRKAQMTEFALPQSDKYTPGFIIRKKRKTYSETEESEKISKQEQREIDELTEFVLRCGEDQNTWMSEDFGSFVQKFTDDSLALDQGCFEIVRGRNQSMSNIVEFYTIDGTTVRIADSIDNSKSQMERMDPIAGYYPSYVQVIDGRIQTEFYPWELCVGVRNPQTNIRAAGYGRSELETLVNTVTDMLNASHYNSQYFRIGSNPKGILKVKNMNTTRIEEFRQNWLADMAGVHNAHKLPIIDADTLDFISTQQNNKDMEYHKYLEFLIKVTCAIYKISPEEIGFPLEGTGVGAGLGSGENKTELEYSKSKGLVPLLRFLQTKMNKYIVGPKTGGKYELIFVGLNQKTEKEELEDDIKKVTNGAMSQQDLFKKYSHREPDFEEDIILNPIYLQYKQIAAMGSPESNEFIDDYQSEEDDKDDDNPFLNKAVKFIDQELNQPT